MRASACASPGKASKEQAGPPPRKKKQGGEGGGAREQPTATKPPASTTRGAQTPHPEGTEDRTPKEAQGDHPAKTGNTKPGTAAHRKKGHRNMQTHTTLEKKKKSQQPSPKERGWGDRDHKARDRDSQQPTQQSQTKTRQKKKAQHPTTEPRRAGHSRDPGPARTPTHRTPARKGWEQAGRAHKHAPPHSNPNQEVQETKWDGRTSTHTSQHPPKERRGAAETQTPALTPTPHTGTGHGGAQAERARNHTRPISRTKPKPNHEHHKQPAKEGQHHKPYPNTPAQDPSQDWRG